jgi:predicted aspartyl protease
MIQGYFDPSGHPKIKIVVSGSRSQIEIEALIDTGFDGDITIPSPMGI